MRLKVKRPDRTLSEAALWFGRLNESSISTAAVLEFRQWRVQPGNAEAFQKIEKVWSDTGKISGSSEIQAMLAQAEGRGRRAQLRRRRVRIGGLTGSLAALAVGLAGGPTLVRYFDGTVYQTTIGRQRSVILPDGSRIQLDTDSRIKVHFTADARRIELLRGRALFDVVHLPSRPMTVRVGDTLVRDLGTRFIVGDEAAKVSVTVLSGSVQVTKIGASTVARILKPGQAVAITATLGAPSPVDVSAVASWTTGRLVFNDLPLTNAILEMNRYETRKIRLDADAPDMIRVSGTYQTGDPEGFAAAMAELYGLKTSAAPNGDILLGRAQVSPNTQ